MKAVPCVRFVSQLPYGELLSPHRGGEQDWDGEILSPTQERLRHSQAVLEGNKEPKVIIFFSLESTFIDRSKSNASYLFPWKLQQIQKAQ